MNILPLDIALIAWLFVGTFLIKALQSLVADGALRYGVYVLITMLIELVAILLLVTKVFDYSAISVVFGGVAFFWFPILSSREIKNSQEI